MCEHADPGLGPERRKGWHLLAGPNWTARKENPPVKGDHRAGYCATSKGDPIHELDVEPQEVSPGETESADRRLRFYTARRPMPVVSVQPDREFLGAAD
jgi:hypothetical protein